jgi:hypothetical protein
LMVLSMGMIAHSINGAEHGALEMYTL